MWPVPRGQKPDPDLAVPFKPVPISPYIVYPLTSEPAFPVASPLAPPVSDAPEDAADQPAIELAAFGSSEFAKAVLGSVWGNPPALDLAAEADLHSLLGALANQKLVSSARDIADGGIAVALAQAAFPLSIGATVEQDQSLMVHPLFGLFAEPASTVLVTTDPSNVSEIESLAEDLNFLVARIGTTGGSKLEISVYGNQFISAPLTALRKGWAESLEATLHDEVTA
jgi:phosphoribosylformylglycinamidine synthase